MNFAYAQTLWNPGYGSGEELLLQILTSILLAVFGLALHQSGVAHLLVPCGIVCSTVVEVVVGNHSSQAPFSLASIPRKNISP